MNLTESLKWMFQSAQKGHTKAQYELGQYHMKLIGQELIKDSEGNVYDAHAIQARFWYKSSAEKGLKEAQSKLGFCSSLGACVTFVFVLLFFKASSIALSLSFLAASIAFLSCSFIFSNSFLTSGLALLGIS